MIVFKPLNRGWRVGPLSMVRIEIASQGRRPARNVVITVPSICGNSVKRNRFRRVVREYISSQTDGVDVVLWIRLSAKFRLGKKIVLADWKDALDLCLSKNLP